MKRIEDSRQSRYSTFVMSLLAVISLLLLGAITCAQAQTQTQWTTATNNTDIYNTNTSTGKVGIGTSAPANPLTIARSGSSPYANRPAYELLQLIDQTDNTPQILFGSAYNGMFLRYTGTDHTAPNQRLGIVTGGAGEAFVINNDGLVGLGTTNPTYRLHIAGDNTASGGYPILKLQNMQTNGHSWWLYAGATGTAGALGIYDETAGSYRMFFDSSGNVGVGTTAPSDRLHITTSNTNTTFSNTFAGMVIQNTSNTNNNYSSISFQNSAGGGDVAIGAVHIDAGATGTSRRGAFVVATAGTAAGGVVERLRVDDNGNVGIGASSPNYRLDVQGGQINAAGGLCIAGDCKNSWSQVGNSQWTTAGSNITYSSGNVGIGTTATPTHTLEVNGSANVSGAITGGTINATFQDVAEWVPSSQKLPAGTVVILDDNQSNHVLASVKSYDTRVAGVVSAQPGISLGQGGEGKVLVATTGRVKVKVDATRAPVHVGDLLVTSDQAGVAMKSEPINLGSTAIHRPGTIIGKALEPLKEGVGEILVLLSLQ